MKRIYIATNGEAELTMTAYNEEEALAKAQMIMSGEITLQKGLRLRRKENDLRQIQR